MNSSFPIAGVVTADRDSRSAVAAAQPDLSFWNSLPPSALAAFAAAQNPVPIGLPLPSAPSGTRIDFGTAGANVTASVAPGAPIINATSFLPLAQGPEPQQGDPLPRWFFRGSDRDMMVSLSRLLLAINTRDVRVSDPSPAKGLSNREYIIDPLDFDLIDSYFTVVDWIDGLLSLTRE